MSPAHHRYRFPILPRISALCALRVSAVGYPFHRFSTPLFSAPSELLFSQLLSFSKTTALPPSFSNCAPFSGFASSVFSRVTDHGSQVTCSLGFAASCCLLPLFFAGPSFVFSSLQPLFAKHRGWGISAASLAIRLPRRDGPRPLRTSESKPKKPVRRGHGCPVPVRPVLGAVTSTRKKGASLWT
jgi:hypothetical protein